MEVVLRGGAAARVVVVMVRTEYSCAASGAEQDLSCVS